MTRPTPASAASSVEHVSARAEQQPGHPAGPGPAGDTCEAVNQRRNNCKKTGNKNDTMKTNGNDLQTNQELQPEGNKRAGDNVLKVWKANREFRLQDDQVRRL